MSVGTGTENNKYSVICIMYRYTIHMEYVNVKTELVLCTSQLLRLDRIRRSFSWAFCSEI